MRGIIMGNVLYLTTDWLLGQFSEKSATARKRYRNFVADGMVKHDQPWRKLVGQIFLGNEEFIILFLTITPAFADGGVKLSG